MNHSHPPAPAGKGGLDSLALAGALMLGLWPVHAPRAEQPSPSPRPGEERRETITFTNGDRFNGQLTGWTPGSHVDWAYTPFDQSLRFAMNGISRIMLGNGPQKKSSVPFTIDSPNQTTVLFTNGDVLVGDRVAVSDQSVTLTTAFAGQLSLPRATVHTILLPTSQQYQFYKGPKETDAWKRPHGIGAPWVHDRVVLKTAKVGAIATDIRAKGPIQVSFTAQWDQSPRFMVGLLNQPPEAHAGKKVAPPLVLQIDGTSLTVRHNTDRAQSPPVFADRCNSLQSANHARFCLTLNPADSTLSVTVNGAHTLKAKSPFPLGDTWAGLQFESTDNRALSLRDIQVGPLIQPPDLNKISQQQQPPDDTIVLANGDTIVGPVLSVDAETVTTQTTLELQVPLARVSTIRLRAPDQQVAPPQPTDVTVWFQDGSRVALSIELITGDTFSATSRNLGAVTFPRDSLDQIDMPPQKKKKKPRR